MLDSFDESVLVRSLLIGASQHGAGDTTDAQAASVKRRTDAMTMSVARHLTSLLVGATLAAAACAAQASALFSFSFSNVNGGTPGLVAGTVTLPDGDGVFAASSVTIDAGPSTMGHSFPINAMALGTLENSFTVVAGSIVTDSVRFYGFINGLTALAIGTSMAPERTYLDAFNAGNFGATGVRDSANATLRFASAAAVPEPATAALVTMALVGLAIGRSRQVVRSGRRNRGAAALPR